jgi:hypothetical protein
MVLVASGSMPTTATQLTFVWRGYLRHQCVMKNGRCIISRMFTCPVCREPSLHFHNIIKSGKPIDRRVRCDICGYDGPITWKEKRSLLVQVGIAKGGRRAKSQAKGS